jgi:ferredoxin-NADP reductase
MLARLPTLSAPPPSTARGLLRSGLLDALATPHGAGRYLELLRPGSSPGEPRAEIVDVCRQGVGSVTLALRPDWDWRGFRAGQHVRLTVEIDGVRETRFYSPACGERADGEIELTVRAHPAGRVSRYLNEHARPGMVVGCSAAEGEFVLSRKRPQRLLLISGGSGITPVMSILRTLHEEGHPGHVTFLHYARTVRHVPYRDELERIAGGAPNVRVKLVGTREGGTRKGGGRAGDARASGRGAGDHHPEGARAGSAGEHGKRKGGVGAGQARQTHPPNDRHITGRLLRRLAPDYEAAHTYVCGPPSLIAAVRALRSEEGIDAPLWVESFQPPVFAPAGDEVTVHPQGSVRFARSGKRAPSDGRCLLEQAERAGLRPAHGCRMGICRMCTARKTAGSVRNLLSGEVSSGASEDIQICVTAPVGDVELAL